MRSTLLFGRKVFFIIWIMTCHNPYGGQMGCFSVLPALCGGWRDAAGLYAVENACEHVLRPVRSCTEHFADREKGFFHHMDYDIRDKPSQSQKR